MSCLPKGSVLEMDNINRPSTFFNNCILLGVLTKDHECRKTVVCTKSDGLVNFGSSLSLVTLVLFIEVQDCSLAKMMIHKVAMKSTVCAKL